MTAPKVAMLGQAIVLLLSCFAVCSIAQSAGLNNTDQPCIMDIVFILDASGSVGLENFVSSLQFVYSVVEGLEIGPSDTRVAMFLFADRNVLQFHLNTFDTKEDILDAVMTAPYTSGGTETPEALAYASSTIFTFANGMRSNAAQVAVIITDGKSNTAITTAHERLLKDKGVTVFAVGVGSGAVEAELNLIATDPDSDHVFDVTTFNALSLILTALQKGTCSSEAAYLCGGQADIMFLLDESSSVGAANFEKMRRFVGDVADAFIVGRSDIQIGLATFSTSYTLRFNLRAASSKAALLRLLAVQSYNGGNTNTGSAIRSMRQSAFLTSAGGRAGVPKIVIVVTDGKSGDKALTTREALAAQNAGIIMLAIGIGYTTDDAELNAIATVPENVHRVSTFDALKGLENYVAAKTCEAVELPPTGTSPCGPQADVVFLVDTSGSVGPDNFRLLLAFINNFIEGLQIGPDNIRVGVAKFASRPYTEFHLNRFDNKADLMDAITNINYLSGGTDTAGAIRYMDSVMFKAASGNRPGIPDIAIIITDGKSNKPQDTEVAAQQARDNGITIFSVGVGSSISREELNAMASDPDNTHVLVVSEFTKLNAIRDAFQVQACDAIPENLTNTTTVTPKPPLPPQDLCRDQIPNCATYASGVCNSFRPWATLFCPKTCQICSPNFPVLPPPCVDNVTNCASYGVSVCAGSSRLWAETNCRKFCGHCGQGSPTTGFFNKCYYKGGEYKQGERWQDGCSYDCECTDASRGNYVCYNKCPSYFNLPTQCSLQRQQGECCLKPVCNFDGSYNSTSDSSKNTRVCVYDGKSYAQGQIWSVGCEKQCFCLNATTGSHVCQSLCAHYDWLPSNCKMAKRPGECCAKPRCEFKPQVGVITGDGSTSGPDGANGTNTGNDTRPGVCVYKGKVYDQDDAWYDGCDRFCVCDNAKFGFWRCHSRCPDFLNLPTNCSMVPVLGQCCKAVHCNSPGNFTSSQPTPNTTGSKPEPRPPLLPGDYPSLQPNETYADGQDPNMDPAQSPPTTGPPPVLPQLTCPAVKEGEDATLTCTADISSCQKPFLLDWSFDSRDIASCTSTSCGGPYTLRDGVDVAMGAKSSTVTVQNVTRDSPYANRQWTCEFCGGSPVACDKIEVHVPPEKPSCNVSEELEPTTRDIVAVRVNCLTTKVYPEAKCNFHRIVDGGLPIPITTRPSYMHIPYNQSSVIYFRSWCSVRIPVVDLGPGTHGFKVNIYPDVFDGKSLAKPIVPKRTVTLSLPHASHTCPPNLLEDYLCGKPNVCNCSLVHPGYPRGRPFWCKRGVIQKQAVGGAMAISYDSGNPEMDFTCEAVSLLGRTFGSSLKFDIKTDCA